MIIQCYSDTGDPNVIPQRNPMRIRWFIGNSYKIRSNSSRILLGPIVGMILLGVLRLQKACPADDNIYRFRYDFLIVLPSILVHIWFSHYVIMWSTLSSIHFCAYFFFVLILISSRAQARKIITPCWYIVHQCTKSRMIATANLFILSTLCKLSYDMKILFKNCHISMKSKLFIKACINMKLHCKLENTL